MVSNQGKLMVNKDNQPKTADPRWSPKIPSNFIAIFQIFLSYVMFGPYHCVQLHCVCELNFTILCINLTNSMKYSRK